MNVELWGLENENQEFQEKGVWVAGGQKDERASKRLGKSNRY